LNILDEVHPVSITKKIALTIIIDIIVINNKDITITTITMTIDITMTTIMTIAAVAARDAYMTIIITIQDHSKRKIITKI
jgi:hypothetical protein